MNNKSLWKLSKLFTRRNSATKKTIVLLAISFLLLFFIIWMIMGFYGYVIGKTQSNMDSLTIDFEKNADLTNYEEIERLLSGFDTIDSYGIRLGSFNNTLSKEKYYINGDELTLSKTDTECYGTINKNSVQYSDSTTDKTIVNYLTGVQVLKNIDSNNSLMKNMSITGANFDNNSKGQILVSNRFLDFTNKSVGDILNQQLSLKLEYNNLSTFKYKLDDDTVVGNEVVYKYKDLNIDIFKNFRVVGVFQDNWLRYNYDCDFIITEQSVSIDNLPTIYDKVYTYKQINYEHLSKNITDNGEFFPFMLNNAYISPWIAAITGNDIINYPPMLQKIQLNNFDSAIKLSQKLDDFYRVSVFKYEMLFIINFYDNINKYFGVIAVISVTLFCVVLINMYNINSFSKNEKNKSFYVYRAMGLSDKKICNLDFFQNVQIFGKSLLIAIIVITIFIVVLLILLLFLAANKSNISSYIWQIIAVAPIALVSLGIIALFCSYLFSQKYFFIKKVLNENKLL